MILYCKKLMDRAGYGLCYLLTLLASVILGVYGFMDVLRERHGGESNEQVVQRQLRGFGFLVLAQLVLLVGVGLCMGTARGFRGVWSELGLQ